MKQLSLLLLSFFLLMVPAQAQKNIYGFKAETLEGQQQRLKAYKGKVLLIVNTATQCGFTPQYNELQQLHAELAPLGFSVLDFPCNQFGEQAPGTSLTIHDECVARFNITFPQFAKVEVNGENAHPLWTYLKQQQPFAGFPAASALSPRLDKMLQQRDPDYAKKADIKWNFTKFLVDRRGRVVRRYEPNHSLEEVERDIRALLEKRR